MSNFALAPASTMPPPAQVPAADYGERADANDFRQELVKADRADAPPTDSLRPSPGKPAPKPSDPQDTQRPGASAAADTTDSTDSSQSPANTDTPPPETNATSTDQAAKPEDPKQTAGKSETPAEPLATPIAVAPVIAALVTVQSAGTGTKPPATEEAKAPPASAPADAAANAPAETQPTVPQPPIDPGALVALGMIAVQTTAAAAGAPAPAPTISADTAFAPKPAIKPASNAALSAENAAKIAPGIDAPKAETPAPHAVPPATDPATPAPAAKSPADTLLNALDANGKSAPAPEPPATNFTESAAGGQPATATSAAMIRVQMGAPRLTVPAEALAYEIRRQQANGVNRFEIKLDPPELGRIDVRLEVDKDGATRAHLSADRQETLDLLQRDSRALDRSLQSLGLKTDRDGLSFSLRQDTAGGGNERGPATGGNGALDASADDDAMSIAAVATNSKFDSLRINIVI